MMSYDIFLILLLAVVAACLYNQARLRNDIANLQKNMQAVRRGLVRERGRIKQRGILRNRELMKIARNMKTDPVEKSTLSAEEAVEWSGPAQPRRTSKK